MPFPRIFWRLYRTGLTMKQNKLQGILGLARKAGAVKGGYTNVEEQLKRGRGALVLIAHDTALHTRKKIQLLSEAKNVPVINYGSKESFGKLFGRQTGVVIMLDRAFAQPFLQRDREGLE